MRNASPIGLVVVLTVLMSNACGGSVATSPGADDTGTALADSTTSFDSTAADSTSAVDSATDTGSSADSGSASDTGTVSTRDADGVPCGSATCTGSDVCCTSASGMMLMQMCAPSCGDASVAITCDGPEDCSGNPCCIPVNASALGATPSTMCTTAPTDCVPAVSVTTRMGNTRMCHTDDDCTSGTSGGSQLPNCCTFKGGGATYHACASTLLAGFSMGAITCP